MLRLPTICVGLALVAGCARALTVDDDVSAGALTTDPTLSVIKAEPFMQCSAVLHQDDAYVGCSGLRTRVRVDTARIELCGRDGRYIGDDHAVWGGDLERASFGPFPASNLPAQMKVTLRFDDHDGPGISESLTRELTIDASATEATPLLVKVPFDVWPVKIVERPRSAGDPADTFHEFEAFARHYTASIDPFTAISGRDHLASVSQFFGGERGTVRSAHLVAAPSPVKATLWVDPQGEPGVDALTAELRWQAALTVPFVIDGPSIWIADSRGIRRATANDPLPPGVLEPPVDAGSSAIDASIPIGSRDAGAAAVDSSISDASTPQDAAHAG